MSDFSLWIRRDAGYDLRVSVRFLVTAGAGLLSVPKRGRPDAAPSSSYEEFDIDADALRGGRFVHIIEEGTRRLSYALSRVGTDRLARLPSEQWVRLEPLTEFGFRYMVLADDVGESAPVSASIAVGVNTSPGAPPAVSGSYAAAGTLIAAPAAVPAVAPSSGLPAPSASAAATAGAAPRSPLLGRARRPEPVAKVDDTPVFEEPVTLKPSPRPAPVARVEPAAPSVSSPARPPSAPSEVGTPALASTAVDHGRVEALIVRVAELERRLEESKAREADLMALLQRWQARG